MFAVVVRETGDAEWIAAGGEHVAREVAPRVRQAPGFVSAIWLTDGRGDTLNVINFTTEAAARSALERARSAPRPDEIALVSADVYTVLATAARGDE
jgi:hypothetical protein